MLLCLSLISLPNHSRWDEDCEEKYSFVSVGLPSGIERFWDVDDVFFYAKKGKLYFEERISWVEYKLSDAKEEVLAVRKWGQNKQDQGRFLVITSDEFGSKVYELNANTSKLILINKYNFEHTVGQYVYTSPVHDVFFHDDRYYFLSNFSIKVFTHQALLDGLEAEENIDKLSDPTLPNPDRAMYFRYLDGHLQAIAYKKGNPAEPFIIFHQQLEISGNPNPQNISKHYMKSIHRATDSNNYYVESSINGVSRVSNLYFLKSNNLIKNIPGYVDSAHFLSKDLFLSLGVVNIYQYGVVLVKGSQPACRMFNSTGVTQLYLKSTNSGDFLFLLQDGKVMRTKLD